MVWEFKKMVYITIFKIKTMYGKRNGKYSLGKFRWIKWGVIMTEQELKERLEMLERYLDKWYELLKVDGYNTKQMVKNDIQFLIKSRG